MMLDSSKNCGSIDAAGDIGSGVVGIVVGVGVGGSGVVSAPAGF